MSSRNKNKSNTGSSRTPHYNPPPPQPMPAYPPNQYFHNVGGYVPPSQPGYNFYPVGAVPPPTGFQYPPHSPQHQMPQYPPPPPQQQQHMQQANPQQQHRRQAPKKRPPSGTRQTHRESPPPSYDQVCAATKSDKKLSIAPIKNEIKNQRSVEYINSPSVEEDKMETGSTHSQSSSHSASQRSRGRGGYSGQDRGKRRGTYSSRGGRGKLRGGKFSGYGSRGGHRTRSETDRRSELTTSSIGQEQDELSIMVQRQLVGELEFADADIDSKGILIEVRNGFSDYEPFALKNFLEYCVGRQSKIIRMIVSSDKQSVIAIFNGNIDCDELETFVAEPQNQFLDLDLDFEEIKELSAAIAFTDEDDEDVIDEKLEELCPGKSACVKDRKLADDVIMFSFQNLSADDLWCLLDQSREHSREDKFVLYPLYPYPEQCYMHVIKDSYLNFREDELFHSSEKGYNVLLSQVDTTISDMELRKVMRVQKISGGDSSAKVSETDNDCVSQKLITYDKADVCLRVLAHSPIQMMTDERVVAYPSLRVDVPVPEASGVSTYFLLVTGVSRPELTKDIIQYFFTNYARHTVQEVYFTGDEQSAVIMFSCNVGEREPAFADIFNGLLCSDEMEDVMAWRTQPITSLQLSGVEGSVTKRVNDGLLKWKKEHDVECSILSTDKQTAIIQFSNEKEAVRFLSRDDKGVTFGKYCSETPVIPHLAPAKLHSSRLKGLLPSSLQISNVVEELGYSEDFAKYVKYSKDKKLVKMYQRCQVFCHQVLHEYRYDTKGLDNSDIDVVKQLKGWHGNVKDSLNQLLSKLTSMDERTVPKSEWEKLRNKKPAALYVIVESEGAKNIKLRAVGTAGDVEKLENLLDGVSFGKETKRESVTLSNFDANFVKYNYLSKLRESYPDATMNLSMGSELGTLVINGKAQETTKIKEEAEEYKAKLQHRNITVASAQWEFLSSKSSRAFGYVNRELLDGVQYFCTSKDGHKLVALTTESKELLNDAEKVLRSEIIKDTFTIESRKKGTTEALEEWKTFYKPMLEKLFSDQKLPLHMIEPTGETGTVDIVTVKAGKDTLNEILHGARGKGSSTSGGAASATKPKKEKNTKKTKQHPITPSPEIQVFAGASIMHASPPSVGRLHISSESSSDSDTDLGTRPKVPMPVSKRARARKNAKPKPLMDLDLGGSDRRSPGIREMLGRSGRDSPQQIRSRHGSGGGDKQFVEEIKLSMGHQYIEYQYLQHFLDELIDCGSCEFEMEDKNRAIKVKSNSSEDVKNKKTEIRNMIRKLNKDTREVTAVATKERFERAAKDLKLWFLLNKSCELLDYDVGGVSVKACKPSIQCIKADAIIVAVKDDLYMNNSGVGSALATADPQASKELRSRYDSNMLDSAGSCQEVDSHDCSVLWRMYLVIVVDPNDKGSLKRGFDKALQRCEHLRLNSVVTNLIGSDMKDFVKGPESAAAIMKSLHTHVRSREKTRLQTLYLCETNDYKVNMVKSEIKKYGKGVEFVESALPEVGAPMISICSRSKREGDEFFRNCAEYIA